MEIFPGFLLKKWFMYELKSKGNLKTNFAFGELKNSTIRFVFIAFFQPAQHRVVSTWYNEQK